MKASMIHMAFAVTVAAAVVPSAFAQANAAPTRQAEASQKLTRKHEGPRSPNRMAYDASDNLYVANWSAGTVLRFSADGMLIFFAEGLRGP